MEQRKRFRQLMRRAEPVLMPGAYDCLSARIAQEAGFECIGVTGAGIAASTYGLPDVGLLTMTEVLAQTRHIARTVRIPVMADCDTGYGNPLNVMRTVREFEEAGVAFLFIEDQVAPKKCGHLDGKSVIPRDEMVMKIRAALDARRDPDLVIMARTDALADGGFEETVARCREYVAAGAEMLQVAAPRSKEEIAELARRLAPLGVPLKINMVEGVRTPLCDLDELASFGFHFVSFSGTLQRAAVKAMQDVALQLRARGSVEGMYPERLIGMGERNRLLDIDDYYEAERRYAVAADDSPKGQ